MAKRPSKKKPDDLNSETIETLWRQALLIREFSRDEIESARRRRDQAETARLDAEREAIQATEAMCANIRQQAESELEEAHGVLEQARALEAQAQVKLKEAVSIKRQGEQEASEILRRANDEAIAEMDAARAARARGEEETATTLSEAGELLARTRVEAEADAHRIWTAANIEIQRIRSDLEAARDAAQRELDTQRTLTDTMKSRAAVRDNATITIPTTDEAHFRSVPGTPPEVTGLSVGATPAAKPATRREKSASKRPAEVKSPGGASRRKRSGAGRAGRPGSDSVRVVNDRAA
ncbi:MAG: hypothetical protein O3C10_12235 [Chloroflexi bacterium]|nr:hypothetical protein [Chloroflexota bacterium]